MMALRFPILSGFGVLLAVALGVAPAAADKLKHTAAVFAGLDKITGRIISFDVATDETVQFGSLQVTPHVCFTRDAKEAPQTDAFVDVEEVETDNTTKSVFSGWMFAASPGLHGVEHPVYDVWLKDCKGTTQTIIDTVSLPPQEDIAPPAAPKTAAPPPRPRQQARQQGQPIGPDGFPSAPAAVPRRIPSQSYFPTAAGPGESPRDRERFD